MKHHALFLLLCISLLLTTSCAPSQPVEESISVVEATVTSTTFPATETMTATPVPTATATPLSTPTAIPEVTSLEEAIPLFGYDPSQPLLIEEKNAVKEYDGIMVHDISFYGPTGGIRAYLVVPAGEGPFPGIVYAHWLGDIRSNRDEFLNEAIEMGGHGFASILIQQTFPWKQKPKSIERDRLAIIKQVISIRRCVDVLLDDTYVNVDPERIAFVGHDYGAMHGSLALGVDDRFSAAILMALTTRYANWNAGFWVLDDNATDYRAALQPFDPVEYAPLFQPIPVFLQYSSRDVYVSVDNANEFTSAITVPDKKIEFYDTDHQLDVQEAEEGRINWLLEVFGK